MKPRKRDLTARKHVGLHIDQFIQLATQAGFACHFHYSRDPAPKSGPRQLVVHIKDNLVTKIL